MVLDEPPGVILLYPIVFPFKIKNRNLSKEYLIFWLRRCLLSSSSWFSLSNLIERSCIKSYFIGGLHLKCTESAQASLTGRWLRCSSRVWVTWNIFANDSLGLILIPTFTGANLSCKLDLSSRMRRLSLVASLPASTKWLCSKSRAR